MIEEILVCSSQSIIGGGSRSVSDGPDGISFALVEPRGSESGGGAFDQNEGELLVHSDVLLRSLRLLRLLQMLIDLRYNLLRQLEAGCRNGFVYPSEMIRQHTLQEIPMISLVN